MNDERTGFGILIWLLILLLLPLLAAGMVFLFRHFDDLLRYLGGGSSGSGPKGPHPLPANDSHILNRRPGQH